MARPRPPAAPRPRRPRRLPAARRAAAPASPGPRRPRAAPRREAAPLPGGPWARFAAIYRVVRRIPRGRVATYGQVAGLAGLPRGARLAGHALAALAGAAHAIPWQRVLGARGRRRAGISIKDAVAAGVQRTLLEREGVAFGPSGLVDLDRFGWE